MALIKLIKNGNSLLYLLFDLPSLSDKKFSKKVIFSILILMTLALSGCKVGPNYSQPKVPCPCEYTEEPQPEKTVSTQARSGQAQHFLSGCDIPGEWWKLFHSEELNCLIEQGLRNSPNVKAAQAAIRVAKQNLRATAGIMFPLVNVTGGVSRQQATQAGIGIPTRAFIFELFSTTVNVTYNLDIWGGNRRQIEAFKALVDYQTFQYEGTYLTLTANIATTAILEASLREQIQATRDLIALNEKQLKVIRQQFKLGGVGKADVLAQETLLAQTVATITPLEKALAQTRHALAALVGTVPGESCLPCFTLNSLKLPPEIPISIPSQLVCQRPDVRSSSALLHQACAQVGVATANLLPQLTLTAGWGSLSNTGPTFFLPRTIVWNGGFQAAQTLFSGGTLIAQRRSAVAAFEQAYENYQSVVTNAFKNVGDSLKAIEYDAETFNALVQAERTAKSNFVLSEQKYRLGAVNILQMLDAQRQYQQTVLQRIQAEALRYSDTVALFQSLGGGWWNAPCPDTLPPGSRCCEDPY